MIISSRQFSLNRIKVGSEQHFNQATSTFRTALIGLAALLSETDCRGLPVALGRRPSSQNLCPGKAVEATIGAVTQHALKSADKNSKCDPAHKLGAIHRRRWS
ncbi:MAG: hypothetical protein JO007_19990 [Alphaproteobacteria bacterium]|nr:hypothetical protein [Alphaproteobacteria bacterium]